MTEIATLERPDRPVGALALTETQTTWTPEQRAALVQLGLDEAPHADLAVFLHQCQRTGLDPFTRQIYMIGRWDGRARRTKYTIQTAIDGFRVVAERHQVVGIHVYGGQDGPYWCGTDGQWVDVWIADTPPIAAKVGIIRKDWERPVYGVAKFSEYAPLKDGQPERMWARMGAHMLAKCAEALALRKAFPQDLSGIYTAEEMAVADQAPVQVPTVIDAPTDTPAGDTAELVADFCAKAYAATDASQVRDLYKQASARGLLGEPTSGVDTDAARLGDFLIARGKTLTIPEPAAPADETPTGWPVGTVPADPFAHIPGNDDTAPATPPRVDLSDQAVMARACLMATQPQVKKIHAMLGSMRTPQNVRILVCNVLANRPDDDPLTSTNDLTQVEASTVIDQLSAPDATELVTSIIAAAKTTTA